MLTASYSSVNKFRALKLKLVNGHSYGMAPLRLAVSLAYYHDQIKGLRWVGHEACTGRWEIHTRKGRDRSEDLGVDGNIILE